jgi:sporulation protein YlmC with PRC-barrel domain
MIRSLKAIEGYTLEAEDGDIGRCSDFLFDDEQWTVRYMVADTGRWLPERKVLVSPHFLGPPRWENQRLPVHLTRAQIADGPPLDSDAPVSRRYEQTYHEFFSAPFYWLGGGLWGTTPLPGMVVPPPDPIETPTASAQMTTEDLPEDTHVRSVNEVVGYRVTARDGKHAGHVEDLLVDDASWAVRLVVVDRSRLPFSKRVLLTVEWIEDLDWAEQDIRVGVDEAQVANAPEFDPREPVNQAQETVLYDYYGRPRGRPSQRL